MYDIFGDVHGQADMLKDLLKKLGYKSENNLFFHPARKAIFVGDFINRGPNTRETISIVRRMVENGSAYAILGNHEINALFYSLLDKKGKHLNKRWSRLHLDLNSALSEFASYPGEWKAHIKWMRTLPMFLDLGPLRVVHACWKDENINILKENIHNPKMKKSFLKQVGKNNSDIARAFWETCKGIDFQLPKDLLVYDDNGQPHRTFRSKWWVNPEGMTFKDLSFESRFDLPAYTIPKELVSSRTPYPEDSPIVFFGHYCMKDATNIITSNICCLDSCVSRKGKLTVYRWNGENKLDSGNII